jgi:hypothetical protein
MRPMSSSDLHKKVPQLLAELVSDPRVSTLQFRRMAMCAGAKPSDFFPKDTGVAYTQKTDILLRMIECDRNVTYVPQFATRVANWLSDAMRSRGDTMALVSRVGVVTTDVVATISKAAALQKMLHRTIANAMIYFHAKHKKTSVQNYLKETGKPPGMSSSGPTMVYTLAAIYLTFRQSFDRHHTQRQDQLMALLMSTGPADEPFRRVGFLKHHTYKGTDCCLRDASADRRWHPLFLDNETNHNSSIPHLRKGLLALRPPVLFGNAKHLLLNQHLFRRDGTERSSSAEIAYALRDVACERGWV